MSKTVGRRVQIRIDGPIAHVILSRPDKHNGMDMDMLYAVVDAQKALRKNKAIRGIVISGEGPSFCAGLDVKSVLSQPLKAFGLYLKLWSLSANIFQRWSMGWRELGVPVLAAIHGNCFGAGIQLALGADIRFASPDAQISIMEAKWGLVPDMGGAALLRELLPLDMAKELTFTGRVLAATEAQQLGLVTHVVDDPVEAAVRLLNEIMVRSPDSVAAGKFLLQSAWSGSDEGALSQERKWQRAVMGRKNQRIAVANNQAKSPDGQQAFAARRIVAD